MVTVWDPVRMDNADTKSESKEPHQCVHESPNPQHYIGNFQSFDTDYSNTRTKKLI
jgi:hypothetical protein